VGLAAQLEGLSSYLHARPVLVLHEGDYALRIAAE